MPIPVDPDLGFVEFALPSDDPEKPLLVDVDVYHAAELRRSVEARYMHELEAAGLQHEHTNTESLRRWLTLLFKPHKVDVTHFGLLAMSRIQEAVYSEIARLAKKGQGSSTPDSPASTGPTASPTA